MVTSILNIAIAGASIHSKNKWTPTPFIFMSFACGALQASAPYMGCLQGYASADNNVLV
jgi:hypothetical protein